MNIDIHCVLSFLIGVHFSSILLYEFNTYSVKPRACLSEIPCSIHIMLLTSISYLSEDDFHNLSSATVPEMQRYVFYKGECRSVRYGAPFHQWQFPLIDFCFHFRTNLAPVILQLKSMGIDNVLRFDFLAVRMDDSTDVEPMPI